MQHTDLKRTVLAQLSSEQLHIDETRLVTSCSTVALWEKYGRSANVDSNVLNDISIELASSEKWQRKYHVMYSEPD